MLLAASLLSLAPLQVAERAVHPQSGHVYVRTAEPLTVHDAEGVARAAGGTLVAIGSAEEETFLLENFGASEGYWIGLEFPREAWSTGEPIAHAHWSAGEPSGGASELFTLLNWGEPGAWGDTSGDAASDLYRALIEFEPGRAPASLPPPPRLARTNAGVLLLAIQDLTAKDLANPRLPNLKALWESAARTADAAGDPSADPLANLGLLAWGVGTARTGLALGATGTAVRRTENALTRLERALPEVATAALLDDPSASGILVEGRVDVRASGASPRKGGTLGPMEDALSRPTPLCVLAAWTRFEPGDGGTGARAKELAAVDGELGALLARLRARPGFADEDWWIALAGLTPEPARGSDEEARRARAAVPLGIVTSARPAGEILAGVGLADLVPSALAHLGVETRRGWSLDGRALALAATPPLAADLVTNGGAEAQFAYAAGESPLIVGWRQLGGFRVARHDPDPLPGDPGREVTGPSCFQGGPDARLEQTIDVAGLAAEIDRGTLRASAAAWLGLRKDSQASIELALEFLSDKGKPLARVVLALPEPGKKDGGVRTAGLARVERDERLPRRTRALRLVLTATDKDTIADGIEVVLARD